jgi:hypothetical protein
MEAEVNWIFRGRSAKLAPLVTVDGEEYLLSS